ncbi:MAG: glycosyltransferase family 4 protein [Pauljensenia sp.]
MRPTLLVTNDFPPTIGGIQSYLDDFTKRLPPQDLTVLVSTPHEADKAAVLDAAAAYDVIRHDSLVLLPIPSVRDHMTRIIQERGIETVWFGSSVPLGLLGAAAKEAGATRVIVTTHGHEVGWSRAPGTRQVLKRVMETTDVVTYISEYALRNLRPLIPDTKELVKLPSGVDVERFCPDSRARAAMRAHYGIGDAPTVLCGSRLIKRKGHDTLIRCWPQVVESVPDARLVIVGGGPQARELALLKRSSPVRDSILLLGRKDRTEMPGLLAGADVFCMPTRDRRLGLEVEGLPICYLEAAATGLPVVPGRSGGAPETVHEGETGLTVDGRDPSDVASTLVTLLRDPELRGRMGRAGRQWMEAEWTWPHLVKRLVTAIDAR